MPVVPSTRPHDVLPTREARAALPKMLAAFRAAGRNAEAFVIGSRRKPEAVVISYELYLDMVERLADAEMRDLAAQRVAATDGHDVDLDAVAATYGYAPEDYRPVG